MVLTSGADPRTEQQTKGAVHSQRRNVLLLGVLAPSCPALLCRGSPGFGSLVPLPCSGGFLSVVFFLRAAGVAFQLPDGRDVGSNFFSFLVDGHRPKNRLFRVSLCARASASSPSLSCSLCSHFCTLYDYLQYLRHAVFVLSLRIHWRRCSRCVLQACMDSSRWQPLRQLCLRHIILAFSSCVRMNKWMYNSLIGNTVHFHNEFDFAVPEGFGDMEPPTSSLRRSIRLHRWTSDMEWSCQLQPYRDDVWLFLNKFDEEVTKLHLSHPVTTRYKQFIQVLTLKARKGTGVALDWRSRSS